MAAATAEPQSKVLEGVFQNVRKAAETNLKMQQEIFQQWTHLFPIPSAQSVWIDKVRDLQKQLTGTVSELARKHREVIVPVTGAARQGIKAMLRGLHRRCQVGRIAADVIPVGEQDGQVVLGRGERRARLAERAAEVADRPVKLRDVPVRQEPPSPQRAEVPHPPRPARIFG